MKCLIYGFRYVTATKWWNAVAVTSSDTAPMHASAGTGEIIKMIASRSNVGHSITDVLRPLAVTMAKWRISSTSNGTYRWGGCARPDGNWNPMESGCNSILRFQEVGQFWEESIKMLMKSTIQSHWCLCVSEWISLLGFITSLKRGSWGSHREWCTCCLEAKEALKRAKEAEENQ